MTELVKPVNGGEASPSLGTVKEFKDDTNVIGSRTVQRGDLLPSSNTATTKGTKTGIDESPKPKLQPKGRNLIRWSFRALELGILTTYVIRYPPLPPSLLQQLCRHLPPRLLQVTTTGGGWMSSFKADNNNSTTPLSPKFALLVPAYLLLKWIIQFIFTYRETLDDVHHHPGPRAFLSKLGFSYHMVPEIWGLKWADGSSWREKYDRFRDAGVDILCSLTFWPIPRADYLLADSAAIHKILRDRHTFPKPWRIYKALNYFGYNVVTLEGEDWKRHRKVVASSFGERNNAFVWDETSKVVRELFDVWETKEGKPKPKGLEETLGRKVGERIVVDQPYRILHGISLMVISAAGFGQRGSWIENPVPPGYTMSFKDSLQIMLEGVGPRMIFPDWVLNLTSSGKKVVNSFADFRKYIDQIIDDRRYSLIQQDYSEGSSPTQKDDLLSNLVKANLEEEAVGGGVLRLSDEELRGNVFIFLIAGHGTTADTMSFVLRVLAVYPELQESLYQRILELERVEGRELTVKDVPKLTHLLSLIYETLRMFPIVIPSATTRLVEADSVLTTTLHGKDEHVVSVPIPQGSSVTPHVHGLHYNPRYWKDPHEFKADRFVGSYPRDAFIPFLVGPRACIGRKFAEVEMLAILYNLIKHYTVELGPGGDLDLTGKGVNMSMDEIRKRVLDAKSGLATMMPKGKIPLAFKRR